MKLLLVLLIIGAIWIGYKQLKAKKLVGRKAEIRPFRQNSRLSPFGTITVTLKEVQKKGDEIWFVCPADHEHTVGNITFDYVMLRAKSDNDDLNLKKPVVCYIHLGSSKNLANPEFIDWGLVNVL